MDTTDPEITFDEQGVCNHCQVWEKKEAERILAKQDLPWILHRARTRGCILGLSGGVDSSFCYYQLDLEEVKPFTFTLDNGWNTPEADENVKKLDSDVEIVKLDLPKYYELQSAFLASGISNIEIPTDHILMSVSYAMARKQKAKTIIGGGNHSTEGIMPRSWGYNAKDLRLIKSIYRWHTGKRLTGIPTISLLGYIWNRFVLGIKVVNLPDYYEYNREGAKKILVEKYGYKDYGEKHYESRFTKWFQSYYLPVKFGIDKRKAHYSSLINSKQMTRDEALRLLEKPPYTQDDLKLKLDYPIRTHRDFKNSEYWWNLTQSIYAKIK